jgi:hypothetical protein
MRFQHSLFDFACKCPVFCLPWIFFGRWKGFATPFFIVVKEREPRLIRHERIHVMQWWQHWIIGFVILYLYYTLKFGYWDNPLEVEARELSEDL